jgi:DUF2075 family protein
MNIESDMKVSYKFQEEVEDLIYKNRVNLMMVRCINSQLLYGMRQTNRRQYA